MKAASLWQPYAQLCVLGIKTFETRSWMTGYRGTLAVHAAKKHPAEVHKLLSNEVVNAIYGALLSRGYGAMMGNELPLGAVVGTVEVVDCYKVISLHPQNWAGEHIPTALLKSMTDNKYIEVSGSELFFGDFTPGRYAWKLANPVVFDKPVPCIGRQGLFNWDGAA